MTGSQCTQCPLTRSHSAPVTGQQSLISAALPAACISPPPSPILPVFQSYLTLLLLYRLLGSSDQYRDSDEAMSKKESKEVFNCLGAMDKLAVSASRFIRGTRSTPGFCSQQIEVELSFMIQI